MELSWGDMQRVKARDIYSFLIRETLNALPAGSPLRPQAAGLGFSGQRNRIEIAQRHRTGLQHLRQNRDVALAFGRLDNLLPEQRAAGHTGANTAAWCAEAEPVFLRGSETFYGDRFVGILGLLNDLVTLLRGRYSSQGVAPPVMLELASASVAAYGYGFFVGYNVEQADVRRNQTSSEERNMARVAVVTGGTRGIGEAISKALKSSGYTVAANYGGNDEAARKFKTETGIPVFKRDVSSFQSCADGLKKVEAEVGAVEILVNNAGITRDTMFHRMKPEQWNDVINTNLSSLFNMCRPVIEGMRERKFGRIINISSINGQKGQMGQSNYSAAKAGELGFTKALAQESARAGITVNAICPGYIATEMVKAVPKDVLEKNILPLIPLGRLGEPEEIARCVVFLASDEAGLITGSTLSANGGQVMV